MGTAPDPEDIAKAAYSSPYHFQRMFHMLTGMTVGEYIRKRKLTLAAHELATSSAKVVDVALKYGYDSPESFAKAFRKIHGIAPSEARHSGAVLKAFPRVSFQFSLKGDQEFVFRIVEKDAFTVAGKSVRLFCGDETRSRGWFWGECRRDGTLGKLAALGGDRPLLGLTMDVGEDFTYMIGKEAGEGPFAEGLSLRTVPASAWAIFECIGPLPGSIQSLIGRIYQEWFPAAGYEHSGAPEIEAYAAGDSSAADYRCEVWIPIATK